MSVSVVYRASALRAVPEAGALRFKVTKHVPYNYPPPALPVTEVVLDLGERRKQSMLEKAIQKPKIVKQAAMDKYIPENLKLIPEGAAPFLKEKALQGYAVKGCTLCLRNMQRFEYTDILLLRQFMTPWGDVVPRKDSGVCSRIQRKLFLDIRRAQAEGLLPKQYRPEQEAKQERQLISKSAKGVMKLEALRQCGGLKEDKLKELGNTDQLVIR